MRYLLLDRITALEPPEMARAIKCVSLSDDIFVDHFPGHPVMPGVLIVEAMAQLGGTLIEAAIQQKGRTDLHALLTIINRAKFRHMVRPGDRLELETKALTVTEDGGQVRAKAMVDDKVVADAELTFAFAKITDQRLLDRRREIIDVWLHGTVSGP